MAHHFIWERTIFFQNQQNKYQVSKEKEFNSEAYRAEMSWTERKIDLGTLLKQVVFLFANYCNETRLLKRNSHSELVLVVPVDDDDFHSTNN